MKKNKKFYFGYRLTASPEDESITENEQSDFCRAVGQSTKLTQYRVYSWSADHVPVEIEDKLKQLSAMYPRFRMHLHAEREGSKESWDSFFDAGRVRTVEGQVWK